MTYLPPMNGGRINATIGGNTAGAGSLVSSGTMTLVGGNNVTLSQNANAITFSAANQTVQTQNLHNVTLAGNTAGAMAQVSSGTLSLAGGNNITLSQNGNAVSIIGAGGGGGIALANSQTTYTSGTARLAVAGGAMTIGSTTGQSFNFSVPQTSSLAAGNGITISTAGNTISIARANSYANMWFPYNEAENVVGQVGQGSLGFTPLPTPDVGNGVQVDRLVYPLYFSNASNATGSVTVSFWMGLYTRTLSSLSLAHSLSASASLGYAGNNNSSNQRGIRLLSVGWTTTLPEDRYYVGIVSSTATAGANASVSQVLVSQLASNISGMWDAAPSATVQWPLGVGFYSATTAGLPSSVAFSQIQGTNSLAARPPSWHMLNGSA